MRIPYKPIKSTGGDPLRPRRLRRCVNQDRSRGRNYKSNRGGHATFNGSVRLDTSGTRPFVEAVPVRTPDAAMRTSPAHVYYLGRFSRDGDFNRRRGGFPEMATSIAGGASTSRQCYPRCPEHQVFQDRPLPCPSTLARRQQFSWRRNHRNLSPRGLRTAVATTTSRPPSSRTEVSAPEGARQIQQGPQPKELPRLPRPEG